MTSYHQLLLFTFAAFIYVLVGGLFVHFVFGKRSQVNVFARTGVLFCWPLALLSLLAFVALVDADEVSD